jgi:hypothetical protein
VRRAWGLRRYLEEVLARLDEGLGGNPRERHEGIAAQRQFEQLVVHLEVLLGEDQSRVLELTALALLQDQAE